MSNYCRLIVGDWLFQMRYRIPYTWCMIFERDEYRPDRDPPKFVSNTSLAKERAKLAGLSLNSIESHLALLTSIDAQVWKTCRTAMLEGSYDDTNVELMRAGYYSEDEEYFPTLIDELEMLEEEGFHDLVGAYQLLLSLEHVHPDEEVSLDLSDFDFDLEDLPEMKQSFVDKVCTFNFLFRNTVSGTDRLNLVRNKIELMTENQFIDKVIIPVFGYMGYQSLKRIKHHGPNEFGQDIRLFHKIDEFGRRVYYGAQVKAIDITATSNDIKGNVVSISNQLDIALNVEFIDDEDNVVKKIDAIMLITSRHINDNAKTYLHQKYPNRQLIILDGTKVSDLVTKYNLTETVIGWQR